MIERYNIEPFKSIWSEESKFRLMIIVEMEALRGLLEQKVITNVEFSNLFTRLNNMLSEDLNIKRIREIEAECKHETIALTTYLEEICSGLPSARFIHYGLTSSDVLDTATALQMVESLDNVFLLLKNVESTLEKLIKEHIETPIIGRSHGMHAEPTTFGFVLAGHLSEVRRCSKRVLNVIEVANVGKLSGPVGNNVFFSVDAEKNVLKSLGMKAEDISTQVVARDRHAEVVSVLALVASCIERIATTIRHLQRSDVGEVAEGFYSFQKGSSAMPHKKNPILSENICGLARLIRSMVGPALEDINLWHERDMSHSSVERFVLPDSFGLVGYMLTKMNEVLSNLVVKKERMLQNIWSNYGLWASGGVLLALVRAGVSRQEAYRLTQQAAFTAQESGFFFSDVVLSDRGIMAILTEDKVMELCRLELFVEKSKEKVKTILKW